MMRTTLGGLTLVLMLVACGGDDADGGGKSVPGVCEPTGTVALASEANGLAALSMPVVSAVFYEPEDTYLYLVIADFAQSETRPFVERPADYLQLIFLLDHGGGLATGAQDVITDVFRDGGASAPSIQVEGREGVTLTVIEANRICGTIDIDDGATTIVGAFEANRINPEVG